MRASCGARPGLFSSSVDAVEHRLRRARRRAAATCGSSAASDRGIRHRLGATERLSQTLTTGRRRARTSAPSPDPNAPRPRISTELDASASFITQLQAGQADQAQQHRDDPEAHHDLGLVPARLLEVVVQRRHLQDPPAGAEALLGELEPADLQHHRQRLDDEDAAHDAEHDLLPRDDRDRAERAAERQRADVAHEDLRRMGVEPQEGEAGAGHRRAEHQQLAGPRDVRNQQVAAEDRIAGDVGEDAERRADHHHRHDRQAVEAVGQVDRIARTDDHEIGQR